MHPGPAQAWTTSDYLLTRAFCPLPLIQSTLEDYRLRSGARHALILATDRDFLLHTLSFAASASDTSHPGLQELLLAHPFRRRTDGSQQNPIWRRLDNRAVASALQGLASVDAHEGKRGNAFLTEVLRLHGKEPWTLASPYNPDPRLNINCLVLQHGGKLHRVSGRSFHKATTERLNGTANASVHRDKKITEFIDDALSTISNNDMPATALDALVHMAKQVTESIAAVTYLYDPTTSPEGRLIAHPSTQSVEQGCRLRTSRLDLQSSAILALAAIAFQRKRPQMLPHGREIGQAPISTWLVDDVDARVEIAVPIPAAPGGIFTPYAGVLVLCRHLDGQPYGNYELALLRNVALRIALLRTTLMMDRASNTIASTAHLFAVTEDIDNPEDYPGTPFQWSADRHEPSVAQEANLPTDFAETLPRLVPMMEAAGTLMGAQSATLRFMTLTEDRSRPYDEMALTKVVEWPRLPRGQSGPRQISITDESITGWVSLHGEVCHIGNVNVAADMARYPGLRGVLRTPGLQTRSVLCIPIMVDQRVVGTLLFQSAHANAFALLDNVGRASAAQVAILLSAIRRRQLREVLSIGSDVQGSAHELMGLSEELRKACDAFEHAASEGILRSSVDTLAEVIGALNAESPPAASQSDTLEALVRRAASRAGVSFPRLSSLRYQARWGERTSRRLYLAMYEVFRNIDHYGAIAPEGFPLVTAKTRTIGGRSFIDLAITHEVSRPLGEKARRLYRVAIADSERLHFGAYTAGAIVRSLGGEVFAKEISRNRLLTLVSIPEGI